MIEKLSVPVSVSFFYDSKARKVIPKWLVWEGRVYKIVKIGLHHSYRKGRTLFHCFSATTESLFFRLALNTDNLHWKLEEISDGMAD